MNASRERLERLLGGPGLELLRERLRRRYELGRANDVFTLGGLSAVERQALEGLLGRRPRNAESMLLSVAEVDDALGRAGIAPSLREALELLDGPIPDTARLRAEREQQWDAVFAAPGCAALARLSGESAGRALVKRLARDDPERGRQLLDAAATILGALPAQGVPLSRLAAERLGDSHALDEGRPVATLVVAALRGTEVEERAREVWAKAGVLVSELASPVLALNLVAHRDTPGGRLVDQALACGEPVHLSLRALARQPPRWALEGRKVFICENPAIVAMAADTLGQRCAPMVCTDGMPAAAQRTLLGQLASAKASLLYHGDFDWPGIAIGNFVMRTFGAIAWRFAAEDYEPRRGRTLEGMGIAAQWDEALGPKMARLGFAVDEEAVADVLLGDLRAALK